MKYTHHHAFIMGELIVALTVLGTLVVTTLLSLNGLKRFNHYQWTRQRCLSAAQAQLDCLAASQNSLDSNDVQRLWPGVTTTVATQPGETSWEGLTLVRVQATAPSYQRQVRLDLARYYAPDQLGEMP